MTHGNRLSEALQAALSDAGIPPAADLAASLCAADPEKALEDLLFPATRSTLALLDPRHQEFADTWNDAKAALAWLSLLAVDGASLGLAQRNALADGQLSFEIVVETPLGVELVSSRHRQIAPRVRAQAGTSAVVGSELIREPPYETGWGDDAALEKLLLEVWAAVFPEEPRTLLSERDLRTLNSALRFRERQKTHNHYVPVAAEQESRLCRPNFYRKLLAKLPAIAVIFFKSSGDRPALLISDEVYLMTIIRELLTIPERLAKNS